MTRGDQGPIPLGIVLDSKYKVRRVLGRGSMGIVYVAQDLHLEREVAIKVLAPHYAANERVAKRFKREAVAMASVRNEHVVQIFAFGDHEGYPYFVMEYVPGYNVATLIDSAAERGEQLYLDVVIGILRQVCKGLEAVHAAGIVHRDVKPANMLIGPRFRVAVTDFGLVEMIQQATEGRDLAGTPLYLAPELIRRQPIPQEQRHLSDIYALGVSTYEMLTGEVPFDGETIKEILRRHIEAPPPVVAELRSDIPAAVDQVLHKALAKDPAGRYQTCEEFITALAAARTGEEEKTPRTGNVRVLIVDDDPETRTVYSTALKVGFPDAIILTADDGSLALDMAKNAKPDLAIVDMNMPGMNGLELCAALRGDELLAEVPIVVVSGTTGTEVRTLLKSMGVKDVIRKPIELTHLLNLARRYLRAD